MTSNIGARNIVAPKKLGFTQDDSKETNYQDMKTRVMDEVKKLFRPEFLNRIDEVIVFHSLTVENIREIVGIMFGQLAKRLFDNLKIVLNLDDTAREYIAKEGYEEVYGARPLKRAIQSKIEDRLAEEILDSKISEGDEVDVVCIEDAIEFEVKADTATE